MIRQILERSATVLVVVFFVIIGLMTNLTASSVESEEAPKYATIHFWADNPSEQRFSHVSLQTDRSYISIRPDDKATDAISLVTKEGIKLYLCAPAVCVSSFDDDCKLQGNRAPDRTFRVKVKPSTINIDKQWVAFLEARRSESTALDATWNIFSGPDFDALLSAEEMFTSSSAIVLHTLAHGEIPINSLLSKQFESRKIAAQFSQMLMAELRGKPNLQTLSGFFEQFGGYNFIFKPSDVNELVKTHIKLRVLAKLQKELRNNKMVITVPVVEGQPSPAIDPTRVPQVIESNFPLLVNEETAFRDCLRAFGTLTEERGQFNLSLNNDTALLVQPKGWFSWGRSCSVQ